MDYEIASRIFEYNHSTGALRWKISLGSAKKGSFAGSISSNGKYLSVKVYGKNYLVHRVCFLLYYKRWPEVKLDHKDRDTFNNRINNLRECISFKNEWNEGIRVNNTSGHHGVSFMKDRNLWSAKIKKNGKTSHLGFFENISCAAEAYNLAKADRNNNLERTK